MDGRSNIANDLFYKVRSRFSGLKLGTESGEITINPEDARFFDFDYQDGEVPIGHVTISLAEPNSMKVYFSSGITESMEDPQKTKWYGFLKELREFAKRRLMAFDTRDISKDNLDRRDFQFLTTVNKPKAATDTILKPVGESVMNESQLYGTNRVSYQKLMDTRLIIKHSKALQDDLQPGARSRNISALFVENQDGERFKYPFIHLAGARAMQRHVANGGLPYDEIGKSIVSMSEQIAQLKSFSNYVVRNDLMNSDTNSIVERSHEALNSMREQVAKLSKQGYYEQYKENFQQYDPVDVPNSVVEEFKEKFTVRSFKEEISSVFPLLYKIMQEQNSVDYDDIVDMTTTESVNDEAVVEEQEDELDQFEQWIMNLGESSPLQSSEEQLMAIEQLNKMIAQAFPAGVDGTNAIQSLKGIIEDPKLYKEIKDAARQNPQEDVRAMIKAWVDENASEIAAQLDFGDMEQAAPETEVEQPAAGEEAGGEVNTDDALAAANAAVTGEQEVVTQSDDNVTRGGKKKLNVQELAEFIQSFYDRNTGTFPKGPEGVCTMVGKKFGEQAEQVARKFVERMAPQQTTDNNPSLQELSRIRELAGVKKNDQALEDHPGFMGRGDLQKLRDALDKNIIVSVAFVKRDGSVRPMAIKKGLSAYEFSTKEKSEKQKNVEQNHDIKKVIDINFYIKTLKKLKSEGMEEDEAKKQAAKASWRSVNLKDVLGFMVRGEFIDLRDENDILGKYGEEVYNSLTPTMKSSLAQTQQATESMAESFDLDIYYDMDEGYSDNTELDRISSLAGIGKKNLKTFENNSQIYDYDLEEYETEVALVFDRDSAGSPTDVKVMLGKTNITPVVDQEWLNETIPEIPADEQSPSTGYLINLDIGINYRIYGSDRPATREDPPEYAELEIEDVDILGNGKSVAIDVNDLGRDAGEKIEQDLWDHARDRAESDREEAEISRYELDRYDSDRYENLETENSELESIRRLSGISKGIGF
jgi:hypothetical protein